ncbi:MAG: glycosyltransferase family 39 protein [Candidatus Methylumidiphilus sp.]
MSQLSNKWIYVILTLVTLLGLQLRLQAVRYTEVDTPVRADARGYLLYAINLKQFHTYSRSPDALEGKVASPTPDAMRTPGYPLFLRMFMGDNFSDKTLYNIELAQALLSTLTILLAYATFASLLNRPLALIVALLTAISPHLVFTNVFILSESLSCFFLMSFLWGLSRWKTDPSSWLMVGTGLLLALTSLTRPWMQYFILLLIPLMIFYSPVARPKREAILLSVGFILPMLIWMGRNLITLGILSDDSVVISSLYQGHYARLMYDNHPETFAYPYRFDPRAAEISASFATVWAEILRHLKENTLDYIGWYVIGKPLFLFSWDIFEGLGDLLIYPVLRTPYSDLSLFKVTHVIMRNLHDWLVMLAALGCIAAWLPSAWVGLAGERRFLLRSLAFLFAYFVLIHCILKPEARYSIPMRPVIYGMAMFGLWYLGCLLRPLVSTLASRFFHKIST